MSFFWPTKLKAEPGGVARLGRVLHWLFVACALAFVIGGFYWVGLSDGEPLLALSLNGGFAAGFFMFGRALRYIFAGE